MQQHVARVGAVAAISGALTLFTATLLHPIDADPNDSAGRWGRRRLTVKMTPDSILYRSLQWLVFLCVALHNLEEGLTAKAYFPKVKDLLGERVPATVLASMPGLEQFYIALAGATLVPLVLTVIATTGRPTPLKPYLVAVIAMGLLLNVLIPHVPAAVALGGYAPGVATAVLVNLPFSIYFLRRSLREGHVDRRGLAVVAAIALSILVLGVPLLWLLTGN